ncbi:MAG: hypothetical protein WCY07_14090 [Pigmentiphaga sp.]
MSRRDLDRFLYVFDKDPALRQAFEQTPAHCFAGFDLSEPEQAVLRGKDLATLYEWGVHPLLIRNFGASVGVKYQEAYRQRGWVVDEQTANQGDNNE